MTEAQILLGLKMALHKSRYKIKDVGITILPTELVVGIYNYISQDEKLIYDEEQGVQQDG